MKFSLIHANRLRKLARHLRRGKLAHAQFDFSTVNADVDNYAVFDHCGTRGCALGEFHVVFPGNFRKLFWCGSEDAESFLALTKSEADQLFVPGKLRSDATRTQVAKNMIRFLKAKGFDYAD